MDDHLKNPAHFDSQQIPDGIRLQRQKDRVILRASAFGTAGIVGLLISVAVTFLVMASILNEILVGWLLLFTLLPMAYFFTFFAVFSRVKIIVQEQQLQVHIGTFLTGKTQVLPLSQISNIAIDHMAKKENYSNYYTQISIQGSFEAVEFGYLLLPHRAKYMGYALRQLLAKAEQGRLLEGQPLDLSNHLIQ